MVHVRLRARLRPAACVALALLLAGCAARQLQDSAPPNHNTSYAPPHPLQEVSFEYVRPPLEVTVSTSGPMNNYNKQAAVEFVDRVRDAAQSVPLMVGRDLEKLSVPGGRRYKITFTPTNAWFRNQSYYTTVNAASRVVFTVALTDASQQRLWDMTYAVVAQPGDDLAEPMRNFAHAVIHNLIVQGWVPATPDQAVAFASIDDADALPTTRESVRQAYRDWLKKKTPRAFVLTDDGHFNAAWGGLDPTQKALAACHARGPVKCMLYAVDDRIVYAP